MSEQSGTWCTAALGDSIRRIRGGGTPSRRVPRFWGGGIPWASVKDFTDEVLTLTSTAESITPEGLACSAASLIETGTPIVCTRMAVGRAAIAAMPVAINQDLKALYPDDSTDARFLVWSLALLRRELDSRAFGSTVRGISVDEVRRLKWMKPESRDEQTAIAGILDTVDEAIRHTAAVIEKLKKIRAGLLHDLLTLGIDEGGRLRDPIRKPEQFKDSPLGKVPKGWEVLPLWKVASVRFSSVDKKTIPGELPVSLCNYIDVYTNEYITGSESFMAASASRAEIELFSLRQGDVLMTKDSETPDDIGVTTVILCERANFVCGYHLALLRPDKQKMNSIFLAKQLRHTPMARYFGRVCNGMTRYGLPTRAVEEMAILRPEPVEQERIAAILQGVDVRLSAETDTLRKRILMKQGLMQDLLTGRVRVPTRLWDKGVPEYR